LKTLTALSLAIALCSTTAGAQGNSATAPWKVMLTSAAAPIPIAACYAVAFSVLTPNGKERARNPAGMLVQMEEFDLTVSGATATAAAGQYRGANFFSVCACQGAVVGSKGTVTARYPSASLAAKSRVPGMKIQVSAPFTIGAAQGASDPPECQELKAQAPAPAVASAGAPTAAPATAPAPQPLTAVTTMTLGTATPAGTAITGGSTTSSTTTTTTTSVPATGGALTPVAGSSQPVAGGSLKLATAGPAPTGLQVAGTTVSATLAWQAVTGAVLYVMKRDQAGVPTVQRSIFPTVRTLQDKGLLPGIAYTYTISANQADGSSGSASVPYTTPPPVNPSGFTAVQVAQGAARLIWQPVPGASYYVVLGPGSSNGGVKVSDTTFIVTGAPSGLQSWSVGSYYDPAPPSTSTTVGPSAVSTPAAQFSTAQANIIAPSVAPTAPVASTTARMTSFDPTTIGFRFSNDFANSFIGPPVNMTTGGLCGGMSYTVLDYFNAKMQTPGQDFRPANGTALQGYLYLRQVGSLLQNLDKWVDYTVNPLGSRSSEFFNWGLNEQLLVLRSFIDRGAPVPLGLKGFSAALAGDHQVLAIGYDMGRYQGDLGQFRDEVKIFIVDPNHPKERLTLIPDLVAQEWHYAERPDRWRSYFADAKYVPQAPPNLPNATYPNDGLAHELLIEFTTGPDDMRGGADHVDLIIRMADNSTQTYTNISQGGRWLPGYMETAQIILTTPVSRASIKSLEISTNATGGLNGDNWDLMKVVARAVGNGIQSSSYTSTPDVPYRFTGARIPFVVGLQ
jgi:hypothetical protein